VKRDVSFALNYALNKGFQIHPDAFSILENIDSQKLEMIIKKIVREKTKFKQFLISQEDIEVFLGLKGDKEIEVNYQILSDPTKKITSAEGIKGFKDLFSSRYSKLRKIVAYRPEVKNLKTISSVVNTKSKEDFYVSGLLVERKTERNITRLVIDDPTGSIEIVVFDKNLQKLAETVLTDQFVMVRVNVGKNGTFITKDIMVPDIPERTSNRSKTEVYAVFLSDFHIGSIYFMEKELTDFVSWLSSVDPVARKIRFILIGGDVVDGVGIFPGQENELDCITIEEQLKKTVAILDKIPKNIKVFIIPGNHDPGRRALPQPAFPKKYNNTLWNRKNFFLLGSPSIVSLNGVKVLMFHGQSIDDVVRTTPGLSYDKPAMVMRQLLKARHLSPIYGSQTPLAPEIDDMMVIEDIPDIFHAGHTHVVDLDIYRGVLIINSGAWQHQTPFQAGVGINPTSGMAVIVNLKNFKVYTKDFRSNN